MNIGRTILTHSSKCINVSPLTENLKAATYKYLKEEKDECHFLGITNNGTNQTISHLNYLTHIPHYAFSNAPFFIHTSIFPPLSWTEHPPRQDAPAQTLPAPPTPYQAQPTHFRPHPCSTRAETTSVSEARSEPRGQSTKPRGGTSRSRPWNPGLDLGEVPPLGETEESSGEGMARA